MLLSLSSTQGTIVEDKYNDSFNSLMDKQNSLSEDISEVTDLTKNITAGQTDFFTWNTFKGLGSLLKVPIKFLGVAISSVDIISAPMEEKIPKWIINLLTIAISSIIIFVIIAALTGGNTKI